MKKLFIMNLLLFCSVINYPALKFKNPKQFKSEAEKQMRKCLKLEQLYLQIGYLKEDAAQETYKSHDSERFMQLINENNNFQKIFSGLIKKYSK